MPDPARESSPYPSSKQPYSLNLNRKSPPTMKRLRVTVSGQVYEVTVEPMDGAAAPAVAAPAPVPAPAPAPVPVAAGGKAVNSPLSATVVDVTCTVGQTVKPGDNLVTLEAMKMNTYVTADAAGTISEILIKKGDVIEEGQALIKLS